MVPHQGQGITMNEICANGYWIIGVSSVVTRAFSKCVNRRKLCGSVQEQRMAELPPGACTTFYKQDSISNPKSPTPLTPNHLLTMNTKVLLPSPGVFRSADMCCERRWMGVQLLAN